MGAIDAHALGDGLLAQRRGEPVPTQIAAKYLSDIHPEDGHRSRILLLRIIIRDNTPLMLRQER